MMLEAQSMDEVALAFDRCVKAGYEMLAGLGHHPNDEMFSFYVKSPSGFGVEYGWGGIVIEDDKWRVCSFDQ